MPIESTYQCTCHRELLNEKMWEHINSNVLVQGPWEDGHWKMRVKWKADPGSTPVDIATAQYQAAAFIVGAFIRIGKPTITIVHFPDLGGGPNGFIEGELKKI